MDSRGSGARFETDDMIQAVRAEMPYLTQHGGFRETWLENGSATGATQPSRSEADWQPCSGDDGARRSGG